MNFILAAFYNSCDITIILTDALEIDELFSFKVFMLLPRPPLALWE